MIGFIGKTKVKIFNEVKFIKIVSHQKLLEKKKQKNLFFLDFSKFLSSCQYSILVVCCFIQFERNSFNSKLCRISQMGCNQVCNIIACVNTRGGVEDTRLEAKDTKKIRGQGQGQPFRGQTLSRPRTGMLEAKA